MTFLTNKIMSWMMDEFIRWAKPCLLMSTTCDEVLSWMNECLVRDNNYSRFLPTELCRVSWFAN